LSVTWALTRSIRLNWSWRWKKEFGCEIPDEDAEKITTVQQAIDYVNGHSS